MKRIVTLAVAFMLLFSLSTLAFETSTSGGVGWLTRTGEESVVAYSFGANIPLVTKQDAGFQLLNTTDYLYSDGFGSTEEVQVIRVYMLVQKNIFSGTKNIPDPDNPSGVLLETIWRVYVTSGSGTWQFIKTGAEDEDDQAYGALTFGIGGELRGFSLELNLDIVQLSGPDIIYPSINAGIFF